jgi:hypothetical protein
MRGTSTNVLVQVFITTLQQWLDGRSIAHTLRAYAPQKTPEKLR